MAKPFHEFRDPVHVFITVDQDERTIIDSAPVQRLRYIHQLALAYLLYPGATHQRFEHSLGVMDLAGKAFDVVTRRENLTDDLWDQFTDLHTDARRSYWRRAVRMAALCHDIGHLPFSHAVEHDLFPEGWSHERLTWELIQSEQMRALWQDMTPPLRSVDVAMLAVGRGKAIDQSHFTPWIDLLAELVVGNAFGVDRMDYLLRDSLHAGVAYGSFDQHRLLDHLRILPSPAVPPVTGQGSDYSPQEPQLGVAYGGLQSAEALLLARYYMFSQVYYHPIRQVYDLHLGDFLREWLDGGQFTTDVSRHLQLTDIQVLAAMWSASRDVAAIGHDPASRIIERRHFKILYEPTPEERKLQPGRTIYEAACAQFGPQNVKYTKRQSSGGEANFPVKTRNGVLSSISLSELLPRIPLVSTDFVFVSPERIVDAARWLKEEKPNLLKAIAGEEQ